MKAPQPRNPLEIKRCITAVCAVLGEHHMAQYYNGVSPGEVGWGIFQAALDHEWEHNFTPEQRAAIAAMYRLTT